jgi:hypothetical protein
MLALLIQPQRTIEALYQVLAARLITPSDRQLLKSVLLEESLSEAEHTVIDRVLYGVRHGLVKRGY